MAIKVEVIEEEDIQKNEYPCLKISDRGIIVEFTSNKVGKVEFGNGFYQVGYESIFWVMNDFKLFKGKLIKYNHTE